MTEQQNSILKQLAQAGVAGASVADLDKRTINSLAKSGFIKVKVSKAKGAWGSITSKGRKQAN